MNSYPHFVDLKMMEKWSYSRSYPHYPHFLPVFYTKTNLSTFCGFKNDGKMELFTKLSTLSTFFTCFLHKNKLVNKKICFVKKDKNRKSEEKS
ncbi:hypothetical protein DXC08_11900 [Clostridium sp. OM07-9AC]|nr:hypothetical protein DXC08_11900 [Clostridium sp. OM07-9AC]